MYARGQELSPASISFKIFLVNWVFKLSKVCEGSQNYNFAVSPKIHSMTKMVWHVYYLTTFFLQENTLYYRVKLLKLAWYPLGFFFFQFSNIMHRLKVEWIACDELCNMLYITLQRTCDIILDGHYLVCHLEAGIFTDHI